MMWMSMALWSSAQAATLLVGPGDPYATIGAAVNAAADGDRIEVAAGLYNEQVTIDKDLEVVGAGSQLTTVVASGPGSSVFVVTAPALIEGFEIDGQGTKRAIKVRPGAASSIDLVDIWAHDGFAARGGCVLVNGHTPVTIISSLFEDCEASVLSAGLMVTGNSKRVWIEDSTFRDNLGLPGDAMLLRSGRVTILRTQVTGDAITVTSSANVLFDELVVEGSAATGAWVLAHDVHVLRSTFSGNGDSGLSVRSYGGHVVRLFDNVFQDNGSMTSRAALDIRPESFYAYYYGGVEVELVRNAFVANVRWAVMLDYAAYATLVQNNIFAFTTGPSAWDQAEATQGWDHNLMFGNTGADVSGWQVGTASGPNDVAADPLFAVFSNDGDPTNDDLSLQPGSPAVDAGNPDPAYNDADGSRSDIGPVWP